MKCPRKGQGMGVGFPPSTWDRAGVEGPILLTEVGVLGTPFETKGGGPQPIQRVHLVWLCASR